MGLDKRIGDKFLLAGPGYGGSCFPKDTMALRDFALKEYGTKMPLVHETIRSNDARRRAMIDKIVLACDGNVRGKNLSILGVTFKANTDDMRDSPSIEIVNALKNLGADIKIYDPSFPKHAESYFKDVFWSNNVYDNCNDADAVVILTDWPEFRAINLRELRARVRAPIMVDLRNMYDMAEVKSSGFKYWCVGRTAKDLVLKNEL
jgi:UDPglucose 6-dehydrogenase